MLRHLLSHARRQSAWKGLTYQQYNVLRIVSTEGAIAQADIARRLLVSAPVVTRLASAMAESGLIERHSDPKDRRSVLLAMTSKGHRRARAMRRGLLFAAHELIGPLPADRRAVIRTALDELQVLLSERVATGSGTRGVSSTPAAKRPRGR